MRIVARAAKLVCTSALLLSAAAPGERSFRPGPPLGPRDIDRLSASPPTQTARYGSESQQFGELRLPDGKGPFAVAIVIHGGCWTNGYATARNTAALASALAARGIAT